MVKMVVIVFSNSNNCGFSTFKGILDACQNVIACLDIAIDKYFTVNRTPFQKIDKKRYFSKIKKD